MDDLHPARGGLLVGERGDSDRRQYAGGRVLERRDRAGADAGVVRAGHKQLIRVRGAELAAERAQALGGGLGAQRCRLCMLERQELSGQASLTARRVPVAGRGSLVAEAVAADLS
jgi:hypothetical protein